MRLHRVVVTWSGAAVKGAAVNVLHFDGTNQTSPPLAALVTAYSKLAPHLPNGLQITVPGTGDDIDDTNGTLAGTWTGAGGGNVIGQGPFGAAAGVGACVTWKTATIVTGKSGRPGRLHGRTFIVPLSNDSYETDGTLSSAALQNVNDFATAMLGSGGFAAWHRPTTVGGHDGTSGPVTAARVRDHVAFLSSRRD